MQTSRSPSPETFEIFDRLFPTGARLVTNDGTRRTRETTSFGQHAFGFSFLRLAELGGDDHQTQIDHEERTDDNQTHEIDPIPEGMSVLNVIHDVHPTLQTDDLQRRRCSLVKDNRERLDLKDHHPGQTDVIETNRTRVGILVGNIAELIVLIPVDAAIQRLLGMMSHVLGVRMKIQFTSDVSLACLGNFRALRHATRLRMRTDERVLIRRDVKRPQTKITRPRRTSNIPLSLSSVSTDPDKA